MILWLTFGERMTKFPAHSAPDSKKPPAQKGDWPLNVSSPFTMLLFVPLTCVPLSWINVKFEAY